MLGILSLAKLSCGAFEKRPNSCGRTVHILIKWLSSFLPVIPLEIYEMVQWLKSRERRLTLIRIITGPHQSCTAFDFQ